jgi:hypothetical protein
VLLAVGANVLWIYVLSRLLPRLKRLKGAPSRNSAVAFYLLFVPPAVSLLQMAAVPSAIEFSRNRAMDNSIRLIAAMEQYRAANGRYPESLLSVWEDYWPGVIGIDKYHYEPSGEAYNLFFEQFALSFGTREFVMYNPRDQQTITATSWIGWSSPRRNWRSSTPGATTPSATRRVRIGNTSGSTEAARDLTDHGWHLSRKGGNRAPNHGWHLSRKGGNRGLVGRSPGAVK